MTANHRPLEEGDIELIDRVRATPCLYDTKDPNFRFVYKKEQEWQAIAEGLDMSHWEAKKRWTVLRDRYARELKQLILHPDSTEYGKNDFFLRMDFIRNFVKKREAKRKRANTHGGEFIKTEKPRPIKLYKVKCDYSSFDSDVNETSQPEKSYSIDYSQDLSSSGRFSYAKQMSQESVQQTEDQGDVIDLGQQADEQVYQDYVEDTSVAYEAVEEPETLARDAEESYMPTSSVEGREIKSVKAESSGLVNDFNICAVEEESIPPQKSPLTTSLCTESIAASLPIDVEEYFSKTIALYLRQLSPRYKIKAKVEMMQIIEKYIYLEENKH